MNVRIYVLFKPPTDEDWQALRSVAARLTNNAQSIRVLAGEPFGWLVAEFTMRTDPQYKAVDRIDDALKLYAGNRQDSTIQFPYTAAQRARADCKNARQRGRRKAPQQRDEPASD
jgi:hypothetical protein